MKRLNRSSQVVGFVLSVLVLQACRPSFDLTYLHAIPNEGKQLPKLYLELEENSFYNHYP